MKKVFTALAFIAIFVFAGTVTTAFMTPAAAPAAPKPKLTIVQQVAAEKSRGTPGTELEAANIKVALQPRLGPCREPDASPPSYIDSIRLLLRPDVCAAHKF